MILCCCVLIVIGVFAAGGKSHHIRTTQQRQTDAQTTSSIYTAGPKLSATNPITGATLQATVVEMPTAPSTSAVDSENTAIPLSSTANIPAHYPPISESVEKTTSFQSAEMTAPTLTTPPALAAQTVGGPSLATVPMPTANEQHTLHSGDSNTPPLAASMNTNTLSASQMLQHEPPPKYDHAHLYPAVQQSKQ